MLTVIWQSGRFFDSQPVNKPNENQMCPWDTSDRTLLSILVNQEVGFLNRNDPVVNDVLFLVIARVCHFYFFFIFRKMTSKNKKKVDNIYNNITFFF